MFFGDQILIETIVILEVIIHVLFDIRVAIIGDENTKKYVQKGVEHDNHEDQKEETRGKTQTFHDGVANFIPPVVLCEDLEHGKHGFAHVSKIFRRNLRKEHFSHEGEYVEHKEYRK